MITIHHLGVWQSDRIVWLPEALGHRYLDRRLGRHGYVAGPAATKPTG